jgi:hypothetical protein
MLRAGRTPPEESPAVRCLVVHENRQQNDDWQRDADQPKQQSTAESHDVLLCFCLSNIQRRAASNVPDTGALGLDEELLGV